jgi:hypothetical protein
MPRTLNPHLLVDITAHGYGHVSQTAPVVNELTRRMPGLRITVRSAAPAELLQRRFKCDFLHVPVALDFGMKMKSAVEVDTEASGAAYRAYHAGWEQKVLHAADEMRALQPDFLLTNVPYLSLAAAHAAGIRAAAMCSLNWADIYRHYFAGMDEAAAIYAQMLSAYNSAEVFFKVQPAMPMPDLRNARSIGPIVQFGCNRRAQLGLPVAVGEGQGEKLILVVMGGIEYRLPMERWPRIPGVRWLVPQAWNIVREDMTAIESLGLPVSDVLASCDALLTKPGYGSFTEAACSGLPVLYVSRGNWPEQPCLVQWFRQNGVCREVASERLQSGELAELLDELWVQPKLPVPGATGAMEAAEVLLGIL